MRPGTVSVVPRATTARLGRPPASSAAETRQRILRVAGELFSSKGYRATTNKDVADRAGITAGALYYYFDSKLDMYVAAFQSLLALVHERLGEAIAAESTFDGSVRTMLEAAYQMDVEDPCLPRFQSVARVDRLRHADLRAAIGDAPDEWASLLHQLVEHGIRPARSRPPTRRASQRSCARSSPASFDILSHESGQQRAAIDGIHPLLDGKLIRPPKRPVRKRRAS